MTLDQADLETMLQDSGGVVVTFGEESTYGHLEDPTALAFDPDRAPVRDVDQILTVPTHKITAKIGATITADGDSFEVLDRPTSEDGALTEFHLRAL